MQLFSKISLDSLITNVPGFAVSVLVAITAQFLSEHYGAPAMLMALLLGIALHFLSEEGKTVEGIQTTSKLVLRIGVALLGARGSVDLLAALGGELIGLVVFGVISTIGFALLFGRIFKIDWKFAFLTGKIAFIMDEFAFLIGQIFTMSSK